MKIATATVLCALVALAVTAIASAAPGAAPCGVSGYNYAGVGGLQTSSGVAGSIRAMAAPQVEAGHVAAWVGFGGYGAGKGGSDAWLQAGIITKAGGAPSLYWEVTRPGHEPELVVLREAEVGRAYRVSVREVAKETWRAFVDGVAVSPAFVLPGSHGRWEATAVAESWDGGAAVCNHFRFAFADLTTRREDAWREFGKRFRLEGGAYRLAEVTRRSFLAVS